MNAAADPSADSADRASDPVATPPARSKIVTTIHSFITTRHFTLWSSIIAVTLIGVLFGLGTWQMIRLQQKNTLIAHINSQLQQAERDLRLRMPIDDAGWTELDYRRVVLQGDWLDLHELKVIPRTYEGQNGYHLLVPLHLADGQIVLVNRGWVPDKTELGPTSTGGSVIVAGIVRLAPTEKPFGMMDNLPAKDQWAWTDIPAMATKIGVQKLAPVILYAERSTATETKDNFPIGGQIQLDIRNEHKNYALTWYSLALALLVIWVIASKRVMPVESTPPTDDESAKAD